MQLEKLNITPEWEGSAGEWILDVILSSTFNRHRRLLGWNEYKSLQLLFSTDKHRRHTSVSRWWRCCCSAFIRLAKLACRRPPPAAGLFLSRASYSMHWMGTRRYSFVNKAATHANSIYGHSTHPENHHRLRWLPSFFASCAARQVLIRTIYYHVPERVFSNWWSSNWMRRWVNGVNKVCYGH